MDSRSDHTQLQFNGYYNTPLLWKDRSLFGLEQLEIPGHKAMVKDLILPDNIRLGNRVERFVFEELNQNDQAEVLAQNTQVKDGKITIGELDCILRMNGIPVHLEIVYKFYLYDPKKGANEIDRWIGPNRNDSLYKKLIKLTDKQLPLIDHKNSRKLLNVLDVDRETLQQRVLFKAQLFTPYQQNINIEVLNKDCLQGFYIPQNKLTQFSACEFYIPRKEDWLLEIQKDQDWLNYKQFLIQTETLLNSQKSPLSWIKFPDGQVQKFFVVWW